MWYLSLLLTVTGVFLLPLLFFLGFLLGWIMSSRKHSPLTAPGPAEGATTRGSYPEHKDP